MKLNVTRTAEIRKTQLQVENEARKGMFSPTPRLTEETFTSFVFSVEGTLMLASTVPDHRMSVQIVSEIPCGNYGNHLTNFQASLG